MSDHKQHLAALKPTKTTLRSQLISELNATVIIKLHTATAHTTRQSLNRQAKNMLYNSRQHPMISHLQLKRHTKVQALHNHVLQRGAITGRSEATRAFGPHPRFTHRTVARSRIWAKWRARGPVLYHCRAVPQSKLGRRALTSSSVRTAQASLKRAMKRETSLM